MPDVKQSKVAILATHGYERSELHEPLDYLKEHGAEVHILSLDEGEIKSWSDGDWGDPVRVDSKVSDASPDDFDALVLPGGVINPDLLRVNADAVGFIRNFAETGKPLAAICHAPWLLAETGIADGRNMTSFKSIRTDIVNAGANWRDEAVVVDEGIITSRNPDDLQAFCEKIAEEIREGKHERTVQAAE